MEWAILILAVLALVVRVIGLARIRRWVRLNEPEPYCVSRTDVQWLERRDSVVGPILKAKREAGSCFDWRSKATQESGGWKYLRTERRKIVYRSDQLAHSKEIVLMVRRRENAGG